MGKLSDLKREIEALQNDPRLRDEVEGYRLERKLRTLRRQYARAALSNRVINYWKQQDERQETMTDDIK